MKKWTIMVYLAGDNNLSEDMIWSLIGMRNAMKYQNSDDYINLVAIYDSGYPTVPIQTYHFTNQNSSKELGESVVETEQNGRRGNGNRSVSNNDTAYIIDFVTTHVKKFGAENYALIMSGHSDNFLGKTMFYDSNPDSRIALPYLSDILNTAKKAIGNNTKYVGGKPKFDLIGFDSCMMGMLEVGCELKDAAKYMVASQGYSPTDGWNYESILSELIESNGKLTPEEFANSIVRNQITYSYNYNAGGRSMCLSCVDLEEIFSLRKSINKLGETFNRILDETILPKNDPAQEKNAVIRESIKNLIHDTHYFSQSFLHEQAVDVLDFVKNLSAGCDLKQKELELVAGVTPVDNNGIAGTLKNNLNSIKSACGEVETTLNKYLKYKRLSGPEYQFSEGVSIFFPWTLLAYNMVYHNYNELKFSKNSGWLKFIERYAKRTLRAKSQPRLGDPGSESYGDWIFEVDSANKAETARAETARAETAKAETAKGDSDSFYKYFRRFRNHPVYHDIKKR
ncbi:MAG: clostripain-related cysteine peptidase [Pyrinomonadaceae bacterium]|nr:clostripain-related cysteine peptidase [Pyrinomonadaceae bacterium]